MQQAKETTQTLDNPGFDQMAQGLKTALKDFTEEQSPAAIAMILSMIKPIGDLGVRVWESTSRFVRRHPVETAVGVVALGFLVATLLKQPAGKPTWSKDGRQY